MQRLDQRAEQAWSGHALHGCQSAIHAGAIPSAVMQMEAAEMQRQHDLRRQEQEAKQRTAAFEKAQAAQKPELVAQ